MKKNLWRVSAVTVIAQVNAKLSESDSEIHCYYYYYCYYFYYYSCKTWPTLMGEGEDKAHSNVWGHSTELGLGGREDVSTNVTL